MRFKKRFSEDSDIFQKGLEISYKSSTPEISSGEIKEQLMKIYGKRKDMEYLNSTGFDEAVRREASNYTWKLGQNRGPADYGYEFSKETEEWIISYRARQEKLNPNNSKIKKRQTQQSMSAYYEEVALKLGTDFYDQYENWLIDPESSYWKWLEKCASKDYSPSLAAAIIERAFHLYMPKDDKVRAMLPLNVNLEKKNDLFYLSQPNNPPYFIGNYEEVTKFLKDAN